MRPEKPSREKTEEKKRFFPRQVLNLVVSEEGVEPRKAMIPTFILSLGMVMGGSVDAITPLMAQVRVCACVCACT